jgi:hypothetical protein
MIGTFFQLHDVVLLYETEAELGVLTYWVTAGPQVNLDIDVSQIEGETYFSVQRRDATAAGGWGEVDTVTSFPYEGDTGPFTPGHVYQYRIEVVGGPSDGLQSNIVSVFGGRSHVSFMRRMP